MNCHRGKTNPGPTAEYLDVVAFLASVTCESHPYAAENRATIAHEEGSTQLIDMLLDDTEAEETPPQLLLRNRVLQVRCAELDWCHIFRRLSHLIRGKYRLVWTVCCRSC